WYVMGRWAGAGSGTSVSGQKDDDGVVDVDTLKLHTPGSACQMKVYLEGRAGLEPTLSLASMCWSNPNAPRPPAPAVVGNWTRTLDVPQFSQRLQLASVSDSICSPTSLAMVLSYNGVPRTPMDVVAGVHDTEADIYGNWPMNTAYAGACGCPAYVTRFWSLEQVANEIAMGYPVEASIKFSRGELDNSPLHYSRGHLVVIVGFTAGGDVVCNDPAAYEEATVRRVYRRDQFLHAWLGGSGGVVYLVRPPVNE
ncbi:MAG: C39 family peptidase, partial [Armatimonadota bacterium]|nr:C39 family peptidase [Armatimonadota bacterium]